MVPEKKTANRLLTESSPYLKQHAYNPVDWYPWGEEAFAKAAQEDKPVLLSIGYSACHWCHVMEKEVYSDPEIASLINAAFIPVKVDREERPDLDQIYMTVSRMMTGTGGWPLHVFMTAAGEPFYTATYIPRESSTSNPGIIELTNQLTHIWQDMRGEIKRVTLAVKESLTGRQRVSLEPEGKYDCQTTAFEELEEDFDEHWGGFGPPPKFPTPHHLLFLLKYGTGKDNPRAVEMALYTLKAMRYGGIYDQVGFGFHRYATDREWSLPHFEKMLCDQAMLLLTYSVAFQVTGEAFCKTTAGEIISYLNRNMLGPEGGYFTSEDADSGGQEGGYYLWSYTELKKILSPPELKDVLRLEKQENSCFSAEKAILPLNPLAEATRRKLLAIRGDRPHPFKDTKILTDWNGLLLAGLAVAARVIDPRHLETAERLAEFLIQKTRQSDGSLCHRYYRGEAGIPAFLTDYAYVIWGLLELYRTTFRLSYLSTAMELAEKMSAQFQDDKDGGFFLTTADSPRLLVRQKIYTDTALPSGNSIALLVLKNLAALSPGGRYKEQATGLIENVSHSLRLYPAGYTQLLYALECGKHSGGRIIITGSPEATASIRGALAALYLPDMAVFWKREGPLPPGISALLPDRERCATTEGKATVYICTPSGCKPPVHTVAELLTALK